MAKAQKNCAGNRLGDLPWELGRGAEWHERALKYSGSVIAVPFEPEKHRELTKQRHTRPRRGMFY
eukprot:6468734-Pyramimonas_sp.AAC.1